MQYLLKPMNKNQQNSLGILETSGNGRKRIHKFSFKIHSFIYFSSLPVKKKTQNKIKLKLKSVIVPYRWLFWSGSTDSGRTNPSCTANCIYISGSRSRAQKATKAIFIFFFFHSSLVSCIKSKLNRLTFRTHTQTERVFPSKRFTFKVISFEFVC